MADITLTLTIPEAKVETALQGFLKIYPNSETIQDPQADPEVDTPIAKYTNAQWVKEKLRRIVVRDVRRGLQMIASAEAQVAEDNDIITG